MGDQKDAARQWKTLPDKKGVMFREHSSRKHGRRPDKFWCIRYRAGNGKREQETLGWSSEGWSADMAEELVSEIRKNIRNGV